MDINNLKQLTIALQLYCDDNHEVLPWSNWSGNDHPGWLLGYVLPPPSPDIHDQYSLQRGLLWPELHDPKVYMCPMDNPHDSNRVVMFSSYVMNGAVSGYN